MIQDTKRVNETREDNIQTMEAIDAGEEKELVTGRTIDVGKSQQFTEQGVTTTKARGEASAASAALGGSQGDLEDKDIIAAQRLNALSNNPGTAVVAEIIRKGDLRCFGKLSTGQ